MKNLLRIIYVLSAGIILLAGCTYDVDDEINPNDPPCDTTDVSFTQEIVPILNQNCVVCHSGATPASNLLLDQYDEVKVVANNGALWGAINHESGFPAMPLNAPKLDDCDIQKIGAWINLGALEN